MRRSELISKIRTTAVVNGRLERFRLLSAEEPLLRAIGEEMASLVTQRLGPSGSLRIIAVGYRPFSVALAAYVSTSAGLPLNVLVKGADDLRLEGSYTKGQRAILIEDVLTSGGVAEYAAKAVRSAGLVMSEAIFAFEMDELGPATLEAEKLTATSVFKAQDLGL